MTDITPTGTEIPIAIFAPGDRPVELDRAGEPVPVGFGVVLIKVVVAASVVGRVNGVAEEKVVDTIDPW
jgi:hypothetical protein